MRRISVFLLLSLAVILSVGISRTFAEDTQEGTRTDKGYQVAKDNYLAIPSDMKVRKIANNVVTQEEDSVYMARKIEELNKVIEQLRTELAAMDTRLKALEQKS